jgi:dipeptidyl aminopeptidase/acylaminoacyl peptidase
MRKSYKLPLNTIVLLAVFIVSLGVSGVSLASDSVVIKKLDIKNKLLFLRNGDVWAYNFENKSEKRLTYCRNIRNYAVSADATKIAYVRDLKKLFIYDTESGVEDFIAETTTDASQPSFSPLGDKIALIGYTKDKVESRFSYFMKPVKQHVRHILIVNVKTKNIEDVTQDIPFQHSQVSWSPDGRWLSFASYRFGVLDKLNLFSSKNWSVYLMDLGNSKHKTTEISGGMSSVWLNNYQVVVSEGVAANVLSAYDVKTKTIKPMTMFQAGFSSPIFSFDGMNNEVVYYETGLGTDDTGLIRSHNIKTNKIEDVVMIAGVPLYVR